PAPRRRTAAVKLTSTVAIVRRESRRPPLAERRAAFGNAAGAAGSNQAALQWCTIGTTRAWMEKRMPDISSGRKALKKEQEDVVSNRKLHNGRRRRCHVHVRRRSARRRSGQVGEARQGRQGCAHESFRKGRFGHGGQGRQRWETCDVGR